MKLAESTEAKACYQLIKQLQTYFVKNLQNVTTKVNCPQKFTKINWLRNNGEWGGGDRFVSGNNEIFNSATVNFSQVQYEKVKDKPLNSATAISTIIHPQSPRAPSVHMHFSFTEYKNNSSYWRLMADLNPVIANQNDKDQFVRTIKANCLDTFVEAMQQGKKYFTIPALNRTRGVAHFYLEKFTAPSANFVEDFAHAVMDCYCQILLKSEQNLENVTKVDRQIQIDYHTLYLFQVLTLDRGTTSGLLVHNDNDLGIMGSIPAVINRELLKSWIEKIPEVSLAELTKQLILVLPKGTENVEITNQIKLNLAGVIRSYFTKKPSALSAQAKGLIMAPTITNHGLTQY